MTHLYLLVFASQKKMVKIGKANSILERGRVLQKYWGRILPLESYYLEVSSKDVFKIEKALHIVLDSHAINFEEGPGKTEFFLFSCLPFAIQLLKEFAKGNRSRKLVKGIALPVKVPSKGRIKEKIKKDHDKENWEKCKSFSHWIKILSNYSHKLKFQWRTEEATGEINWAITFTEKQWSRINTITFLSCLPNLVFTSPLSSVNFGMGYETEPKQHIVKGGIYFGKRENDPEFSKYVVALKKMMQYLPEKSKALSLTNANLFNY